MWHNYFLFVCFSWWKRTELSQVLEFSWCSDWRFQEEVTSFLFCLFSVSKVSIFLMIGLLHSYRFFILARFREKTVNDWDQRHKFQPRPGKYTLLEMEHGDNKEDIDVLTTEVTSMFLIIKLDWMWVQNDNIMAFCCILLFFTDRVTSIRNRKKFGPVLCPKKHKVSLNSYSIMTCSKQVHFLVINECFSTSFLLLIFQYVQSFLLLWGMKQLQIDVKKMPLGKLSKTQIQKGYKVCFLKISL
jgi:hypothetical protein